MTLSFNRKKPLPLRGRRFARAAVAIAALALSPARVGHADPPPFAAGETPFLFGADWPVNGSPAVKALFYETGCNFVRVTGGGYGWALDGHRKALQELDAHGIRALVQLGSHYPEARFFAFKDSYLFDQKGETGKEDRNAWAITYNGSAWPQYSYASETFRTELTKDFANYLAGLKDQKNVSALLLHNEPGYHWINDRLFDYNPQAVARFRTWLREKHGTVETLNGRWGSRFAAFDAAEPPRDLPPAGNVAAWLDWRRFHADLIRDFLRAQIDFARRTRPGTSTTTNLAGPLDNWFPVRVGDNYRFTADFDIAGIDIYPTEWTAPVFPGFAMDMTRGAAAGKKIYVAECEVFDPARFKGLSEEARADMLRAEVWTFIGHGADAVLLWSLSGQGGFHLTDGEFNARVAATREIAHLSPMLHLGAFRKPEARVAVCVDQDTYLFYGGREPNLDGGFRADQSARGLYGAVTGARHPADVVSADQIREGLGKRYAALVLSAPVLMDAELAAKLRAYVEGGGLLIAEAPLAARDRWGREVPNAPGFGLDAVFGVRDVRPPSGGDGKITTPDGEFAGQGRTDLRVDGAKVVGTFADGKPAVTVNRFGKGTAVYVAAEVGGGNASRWVTAGVPNGLRGFVGALLSRHAGLRPPAEVAHQGETFLDASVRGDARGNRLIVLAGSTDRGKPLPPATGVSVAFADAPGSGAQAFAFPPARRANGRVAAGPQPVKPRPAGAGRTSLALPDVPSALPVLVARDFAPLVAIDAPETTAPGAPVEVRVTCYNPSPRPLRVTPGLSLPEGWKAVGVAAPFVVPPRGAKTVALAARAGTAGRAPVKARIRYTSGTAGAAASTLESVPVDVQVQASPP